VRSELGKGSVFHAILPRTSGRPPVLRIADAPAGAPRVLVVEDDPADQRELADALSHAGYAVEVVSSGKQAIARSKEGNFDAVTLDLLLPDMSGLAVLRHLRGGSENREVPVIIVTVVPEHGAVAGFAVQDVLGKPVEAEQLRAALARAGVSPNGATGVLVIDDDPAALRLMSTALESLGYQACCSSDASAALRSVAVAAPTAIVLDLLMPGMSGFEFLDQLRSAPEGRDIPVIVWTSKDLTEREHAMLRASANAVVAKGRGGTAGVISELAARGIVRGVAAAMH
jgi:CheY-like chemotaxis protein